MTCANQARAKILVCVYIHNIYIYIYIHIHTYTCTREAGAGPVPRGVGVGAFADRVVTPETGAVKFDEDMPLDVACVIGCAVQTGTGAVLNAAGVQSGDTVLIMGLGGVGLSAVQGARVAGASRILVSDPVSSRREAAMAMGATDLLDPMKDDVVAAAQAINGVGVDYAFEGAGHSQLILDCMNATRSGGTTTMVGAALAPLELPMPALLLTQEKKLQGCLLGSCNSHRDIPRFLALWRKGALDLESMISHRHPIEDVNVGLDHMRASRGLRHVLEF